MEMELIWILTVSVVNTRNHILMPRFMDDDAVSLDFMSFQGASSVIMPKQKLSIYDQKHCIIQQSTFVCINGLL